MHYDIKTRLLGKILHVYAWLKLGLAQFGTALAYVQYRHMFDLRKYVYFSCVAQFLREIITHGA